MRVCFQIARADVLLRPLCCKRWTARLKNDSKRAFCRSTNCWWINLCVWSRSKRRPVWQPVENHCQFQFQKQTKDMEASTAANQPLIDATNSAVDNCEDRLFGRRHRRSMNFCIFDDRQAAIISAIYAIASFFPSTFSCFFSLSFKSLFVLE